MTYSKPIPVTISNSICSSVVVVKYIVQ